MKKNAFIIRALEKARNKTSSKLQQYYATTSGKPSTRLPLGGLLEQAPLQNASQKSIASILCSCEFSIEFSTNAEIMSHHTNVCAPIAPPNMYTQTRQSQTMTAQTCISMLRNSQRVVPSGFGALRDQRSPFHTFLCRGRLGLASLTGIPLRA